MQYGIYQYFEGKEYKEAYTKVHRFVDKEVTQALRETEIENSPESDNSPPVRRRYVLLDEIARLVRDPIQLRYRLLAVFLLGRDVTALFQLARHQDETRTLLNFETLTSLEDFRYVFQETLRIVGPAAGLHAVNLSPSSSNSKVRAS